MPPEARSRRLYASGGRSGRATCWATAIPRICAGQFLYSNISSHLVAAVLASALQRADGDAPRSVLDYAREKLFDPLEIDTQPAFTEPVLRRRRRRSTGPASVG